MRKETKENSPVISIQRLAADIFFYAPIGHVAKRASDIKVQLANKSNEIEISASSAKAIGKFSFAFVKTKASRQIAAYTSRFHINEERPQENYIQADADPISPDDQSTYATRDLSASNNQEKVFAEKNRIGNTESFSADDQNVDAQNDLDTASQPQDVILPIRGYDTLAASQLIERLGSLSIDELEVVYNYELGHRQRRTILTKIIYLKNQCDNA